MTKVSELIESYERVLGLELDIVRAALQHTVQKGFALETAVAHMLRKFLPESIGVTEGVVVDSSGFVSSQIDIILYDKHAAQLFLRSENTKIVPAEFVFAIGEVKAILDKPGYERFHECQKAIKDTERHYHRSPKLQNAAFTYHGYGRDWSIPPIASFIVAFDAPDTVYKWALESRAALPENDCIDAILALGRFSIHRVGEGLGPDLIQGKICTVDLVRSAPLYVFLAMLAKASAHWRILEPVSMFRYFQEYSGFDNSLITQGPWIEVTHRYLKLEGQ